jgi:uncharacterized protein (TIGR02996 family)
LKSVYDAIMSGGEEGALVARASSGEETDLAALLKWLLVRDDPRGTFGMMSWALGQGALTEAERHECLAQLAALRSQVDPSWELLFARFETPLNCGLPGEGGEIRFLRECGERWESMQPLSDPNERACSRCHETVHLCETRDRAETLAGQGVCITVPAKLARGLKEEAGKNVTGRPDWRAYWARRIFKPPGAGAAKGLDALSRAVLARPLDDAPRHAYADALGADPRAEFIRLQLRSQGRGGSIAPRERELLERHRGAWLGDLAGIVENAGFSRGFVDFVAMDAKVFLTHHTALFAAAPLTDLGLNNAGGLPELFAVPELSQLRALTLTGGLTDADASALAACHYLSGLVRLDLRHNRITRAGLDAIAASPHLRNLRGLDVSGNPVPDPRPTPLGEWPDIIWQKSALHHELVARYGELPWLVRQDEGGLPAVADL